MIFFLPRANDTCFLGCLRSLSISDNEVISGIYNWSKKKKFYSNQSNFLKKIVKLPNPAKYEKKYLHKVIKLGKDLKIKNKKKTFYLPTSDTNMMIAINNWSELSKYFFILGNKTFSRPNKNVFCKYSMFKFLKKNKISTPETMIYNENNCKKMLNKFGNFIIKPSVKDYAQSFYKKNFFKAVNINSIKDLRNFKKKNKSISNQLIIQKKINFLNSKDEVPNYVYADKNFRMRFSISAVKNFIFPKKYGTAAILSITKNKEIDKISKRIIKSLKWRGILMIEFIYNKDDKKWYVIEMNGRPWLMIDFFRRLGFSFLKLLNNDILDLELNKIIKNFKKRKNKILKYNPMHVDLSLLNNSIKNKTSNLKLIKKIVSQSKNITFTSLDDLDKQPFYFEKKNISKKLFNIFNI